MPIALDCCQNRYRIFIILRLNSQTLFGPWSYHHDLAKGEANTSNYSQVFKSKRITFYILPSFSWIPSQPLHAFDPPDQQVLYSMYYKSTGFSLGNSHLTYKHIP